MKYKASLDTLAKLITAGTLILFIVLGYRSVNALAVSEGNTITIAVHTGTLLLSITILLVCYLLAPQSYLVDDTNLTIVRYINNKKIKLTDITEIRTIADSEMIGTIRTLGIGGLFCYYGKYYNSKIGTMIFYATQRKNRILIQTKQGGKIIITPDDLCIIEKIKEILNPIV